MVQKQSHILITYTEAIRVLHTRTHMYTQRKPHPTHRVTEEDSGCPSHLVVAPSQGGRTQEEAEKPEEGVGDVGSSKMLIRAASDGHLALLKDTPPLQNDLWGAFPRHFGGTVSKDPTLLSTGPSPGPQSPDSVTSPAGQDHLCKRLQHHRIPQSYEGP